MQVNIMSTTDKSKALSFAADQGPQNLVNISQNYYRSSFNYEYHVVYWDFSAAEAVAEVVDPDAETK